MGHMACLWRGQVLIVFGYGLRYSSVASSDGLPLTVSTGLLLGGG